MSISKFLPDKKSIILLLLIGVASNSQSKEFDVFTDVYKQRIEIGEFPINLVNDFNSAQTSLLNRRSELQLEAKKEAENSNPNTTRIYQINCIEVPDIMNAMIVNETSLLNHAKKDSDVYVNFSKLITETKRRLAEREASCLKLRAKIIQSMEEKPFTIHKYTKRKH